MATFQAQVEGLTGLSIGTSPTTGELTQFLKDGVLDVTNKIVKLSPRDMDSFLRESAETTSNASLDLNGAQVVTVVREDGVTSNNWRPCQKISPAQQYLVTDVNSLQFASKFFPKFMVGDNGTISVFPAPGADPNAFKVYYINNVPQEKGGSSLDYSHSDIKYFVDDKVYLVVMYAGIKSLQNALSAVDISTFSLTTVPPDVPTITASTVSFGASVPTYSKPTLSLGAAPSIGNLTISVSAPSVIAVPDISGVSVGAITVASLPTAPDYVSPTTTISGETWASEYPHAEVDLTTPLAAIATNVDLSNAVVDAIPVPPDTPSLTSITFSSIGSDIDATAPTFTTATLSASNIYTGSVPAYTKPTVAGDGDELTDISILDTDNTIDVHADQLEFDQWWATAAHLIEGEEDTELATVQLQKIQAYIAAHQSEVQNELNEFNKENVAYQSAIQESVQELQVANQVNIAQGQASLQVAMDNENRSQQRQLQNSINDMQAIMQNNQSLINKYQAELGVYQAEVGAMSAQSQGYLQTAQGYASEIQTRLSATQAKVSEYQIRVQDALNEFNDANVVYQAGVQRNLQQAQIDMQDAQKEADIDLQEKIQDYTLTLQKFQADVQHYQAIVNDEVQEYQQNLQGDLQVWQTERQTDLQEYASDIQNELNNFNELNAVYQAQLQVSIQDAQLESAEEGQKLQKYAAELQEYQAEVAAEVQAYQQEIAEKSTEYQWQTARLQDLKQEYAQAFAIMAPAPSPQQPSPGNATR